MIMIIESDHARNPPVFVCLLTVGNGLGRTELCDRTYLVSVGNSLWCKRITKTLASYCSWQTTRLTRLTLSSDDTLLSVTYVPQFGTLKQNSEAHERHNILDSALGLPSFAKPKMRGVT